MYFSFNFKLLIMKSFQGFFPPGSTVNLTFATETVKVAGI